MKNKHIKALEELLAWHNIGYKTDFIQYLSKENLIIEAIATTQKLIKEGRVEPHWRSHPYDFFHILTTSHKGFYYRAVLEKYQKHLLDIRKNKFEYLIKYYFNGSDVHTKTSIALIDDIIRQACYNCEDESKYHYSFAYENLKLQDGTVFLHLLIRNMNSNAPQRYPIEIKLRTWEDMRIENMRNTIIPIIEFEILKTMKSK